MSPLRCPVCLAPLQSTPQGLCAYCGNILPILSMASTPDYSESNAAGYQDIQAAQKAGVAPSPTDSALLRMPPPKVHALVDPATGKPLDLNQEELESIVEEGRQGLGHPSDPLASRLSPFRGEASSAEVSLEDTPEAEEFLHSFDEPAPPSPESAV